MKWYSIKDIMAGYSLSKSRLTTMCRTGELGAMRIRDERYKNSPGQFLIPEAELIKLAAFKVAEPLYKPEHQPSEFLTLRNQDYEAERMNEIVGDYKLYLLSEHWKHIRDMALNRDAYTCRICGTGINLRVHHVNYEHVGTEQELDDVVTLCEECHSKVHINDYVHKKDSHDKED